MVLAQGRKPQKGGAYDRNVARFARERAYLCLAKLSTSKDNF
jgi:hypothetical protein